MVTKRADKIIGQDAIVKKGWLQAHKWLLLRRFSQLSILFLFLLGPLFGIWIIKGNMSSSLTLDTIPLTDPFVFLQTLFTGYIPELTVVTGAAIVALFYFIVGGRVYCAWVCPINIVTDVADWLRRVLKIKTSLSFSRMGRYGLLMVSLLLASVTGMLVWELVNPVTMIQRELVFGMGLSWLFIVGIFILDAFVSRRAWCSHLCPMGAFYSGLGQFSLIKVNALNREACNDCMDCFAVCPEPQVIKPALKGDADSSPIINSGNCTNCGRCIDVCAEDVFTIKHRFVKSNLLTSQHEVHL
ncbi:MAG: quinol dehydrogenase ferredoxin subunit NapH [endosymbiont of Galathealinum brachiosum]|uniref:Quinol dehydrogenase ferredoxin subunit NapH n=1 Tax=endosymbiont of Galathealinum brachiosum TaxID=2200906 RepID=A0A370D858_9GAMM|nr:MAG: quinol dehydrogenase ferredoxin subunit NapH [endosymbiont of Galathealinum brachiosum]